MGLTRREFLGVAGGASAAAALGLAPKRVQGHEKLPREVKDAITHRSYDSVKGWTNWLRKYGAKGLFCETGWPNDQDGLRLYADGTSDIRQWQRLANKIYSWLDNGDVWVTAWTAGITVGPSIWRMYSPENPDALLADRVLGVAHGQAKVVEAHPTTAAYKRGMNASGGELHLGIPKGEFSNANSGVYGEHYVYPNRKSLAYLAGRGHKLVRLPFRWERVQPHPYEGLSLAEVKRLKDCVANARLEGLMVILDLHNHGGYIFSDGRKQIGKPELPISAFKDVWRRLSLRFKDDPGVAGYQLMNEPRYMPSPHEKLWEEASQAAVRAVRATGDKKRLMVAGYHNRSGVVSGGVHTFVLNHPKAWINDPANRTFYTTSGYWGHYGYSWTYDESNAYWASKGY